MRQGQVGRADLLRAFDSDGSPFQEQLARHLGFDVEEVVELSLEPTVEFRAAPATASKQVSDETLPAPVSQLFKPEPMWFWLPESISPRGNVEVEIEDGSVQGFEVSPRSEPRVTESLRFEPLASTSSVLFRLRQLAELQQPGHRPDLNRIVRIISDGRTLSRIPRQTKKTWGAQLSVIVDLSRHLIPYRHDWRHFRDALSRHLSNTELTIAELPDGLCRPVIRTPVGRRGEECAPPAETVVIAVSDLGCLATGTDWSRKVWEQLGREFSERRVRCVALFPGRPEVVPQSLQQWWTILPWERGVRASGRMTPAESQAALQRLMSFLSLAVRIDPRLLRSVRKAISGSRFDAGLEAQVWHYPLMQSDHAVAATINPAHVDELMDSLAGEDGDLIRSVLDLIYRARLNLFEGIWHTEVVNLPQCVRPFIEKEDIERAVAWFEAARESVGNGGTTLEAETQTEFIRLADGYHQAHARRCHGVLDDLWALISGEDETVNPPETLDPRKLGRNDGTSTPESVMITQRNLDWVFQTSAQVDSTAVSGTQLAVVQTVASRIRIDHLDDPDSARNSFDIASDFWAGGEAPDWASDWDIDEFGLWAEFRVAIPRRRHDRVRKRGTKTNGAKIRHLRVAQRLSRKELADRLPRSEQTLQNAESGGWVDDSTLERLASELGVQISVITAPPETVTQRMRWVGAGSFLMGSPEGEPGRRDNEGPQHEVRISRGFWMFDTPCTQALWEAVMGENPSRFQTPDRPVENVSWEDCQKFFEGLKERVLGLDIALPTEAEWEFSCRAGEGETPYNGAFEILGSHNAPALDPFAWYGGNSGVDFELADGVDLSSWSEKQYEFDKAGTHPVAKKKPNRLGLFDMLGNVDELCRDGQRSYEDVPTEDPIGSEEASAYRVIRGGSWINAARYVRAAYRSAYSPGNRSNDVGFRCRVLSSGPSQAAAEQAGQGGSPQRAVSRRSPKAEPGGDSEHASEVRPTRRVSSQPTTQQSRPNAASAAEASESSHLAPRDEPTARLHGDAFLKAAVQHFDQLPKPEWASDWGRDDFGLWAEFHGGLVDRRIREVARKGRPKLVGPAPETITQRMRLIPPGTFLMGSLETEEGRDNDEGPQHEVTISQAFWMFDSPCTQLLWEAVTGDKPSHFKGGDRPVEQISWEDCQKFSEQLSAKFASLESGLPTEAEWEYACRAGTTTSTYAGTLVPPNEGAGEWDRIAWVSENSGRETHPVRKKDANPWGLFDTLGNVWEWCQDAWQNHHDDGPATDPVREGDASASRVFRGGSWFYNARNVRAAYRHTYSPGNRNRNIGFRCRVRELKIQQLVELAAAGGLPASREGKESVERRSRKAEPGGDSETASVARAAWINLLNSDSDQTPIPKSPAVRIVTDVEELTLRKIQKPSWASAIGRDRFGLWCEFEIASDAWQELGVAQLDDEDQPPEPLDESAKTVSLSPRSQVGVVTQRLRWIPPGQFLFGSPNDEPGRWDGEFEPTLQSVGSGFWMFDTPCTQQLWTAVMGRNPANFRSGDRPVETVNWHDCRSFVERFASLGPGLGLELPNELHWEYACRAGTDAATYAGPVEYIGDGNAPAIDPIAWYGGNCGVDFDLENGQSVSWLDDKQYEFKKGGTRPVRQKMPNAWGLFDTLGNVYEWCDVWRERGSEASDSDEASASRVFRGGSWYYSARYVRAAYRFTYSPGFRNYDVGFRCRVRELKPQQVGSVRGAASAERRSPMAEPGEDSVAVSEEPHVDESSKSLFGGIVDRFRGKKSKE
ncbi:MAG: SUMF1/EgtB/PvdO family nonheme iron enzyme [Planctomycetales bacterium]